jgi:hypothetical protein
MNDRSTLGGRLGLIVPLLFGLVGTALGYILQGYYNQKLEEQKFEAAIIQKALETNDQDEVAKRLSFYVDIGIIQSLYRDAIKDKVKRPGELPKFPAPLLANARVYLLAPTENKAAILSNLRAELAKAGFNVIGQKTLVDSTRPDMPEIRYFHGSDQAQAEDIADAVRKYFNDRAVAAKQVEDAKVRPGYIEIWTGR